MPGILIIKVPISRFSLSQTETQDVFYPIQANAVFAQANQAVDVDVDVAVDVDVDADVDADAAVDVDADADAAADADVAHGAQSSDEIAAAPAPSRSEPQPKDSGFCAGDSSAGRARSAHSDTAREKDRGCCPHGEYGNVLLTEHELQKLKAEFPADWSARIERLSEYIAQTGKQYRSHFATIRAWARNGRKDSFSAGYSGVKKQPEPDDEDDYKGVIPNVSALFE